MQTTHNAPESGAFTLEEHTIFDNARQAITLMKRTFETWVVIGRAVDTARKRAVRLGGRQTFRRIIEQQGLGDIVDKATASRLLRIMDNLPDVEKWRQGLTARQQINWAAPTAVFAHCSLFKKPSVPDDQKPLSPLAQHKQSIAVLEEKNHKLEQQLRQREDGDLWKPSDSARDIARVMVGALSQNKATEVARQILELLGKVKAGRMSKEALGQGATSSRG
jgi:hypothetical protein